ncbi:MAG TPA: hypothetical protein VNP92_05380, partial [Actinophytocola sp.]|nr:hypothetical protein [Actinophytocola sp.]
MASNDRDTLTPEVRVGEDRAIGDPPNWAGFDSRQLYEFATRNNDPATADALGRAFDTGGNGLAEAADGLVDAMTRLDEAWRGVAADSARAALEPLAAAAGQAGRTAQLMGVQLARQSAAATEVRKLPPPQTFDQKQSLTAMLAGGPATMQADLKAQKEAADAVKREQIAFLTAYTQAMSAVDAQTPSFVPPSARDIDPGAGGDARIAGGFVPHARRHGGAERGAAAGAESGGVAGVTPAVGADRQAALGSEGTLASNSGFGAAGPGPAVAPGAPVGGAPQGTAPPGAFTGALGGAVAGVAGGLSTGRQSERQTESGQAARGSAGAGGAAGPAGLPGARPGEEEDEERDRPSYLLAGDPEGMFGGGELTSPPVIGVD